MKRILLILLFTIHCSLFTVFGQQGEWTWMNGDSTFYGQGNYGPQGVFGPSYHPSVAWQGAQWTDKNGNFWLLGTWANSANDDLWEYKPSINQWAWMNGTDSSDQIGVYGIQNVPSPLNKPGGRMFGMTTWVDTAGNLWLFSGRGEDKNGNWGDFNDLWMYNISTNEWTWVKGSDTVCSYSSNGIYGSLGIENSANNPSGREQTSTTWTDNNNNLWLFGGDSWCGSFNSDLWRFNIATNCWTWMKGDSIQNQPSVYGIKGVPDPANKPGSRICQASWKSINDDFWLFGGEEYSGGFMNDLWRYNIQSNEWTWMSGTNIYDTIGVDNGQCIPDSNNIPTARSFNNSWTRPCDNFVMFGGFSYNTSFQRKYDDMWNYNVFSNKWTLMNGSLVGNQPANYGSPMVPSPTNSPGGRAYSLNWIDNSENLWVYSGAGDSSFRNDLWKFVPDTTCPVFIHSDTLASAFNALPLNGCSPLTVTFNNLSINGTNFQWIFGDGTSGTTVNATHVYSSPGTYHVKLISLSKCSGLIDSSFTTITVLPDPNPIIIPSGPTTFCPGDSVSLNAGNYSSFLWSNNSTNQSIIVFDSGIYVVTVTDVNGCTGTASQIITIIPPIQVSASFTADTLQGCAPLAVNFSNTSINGTSYLWNFGDGSTGTVMNPAHTYTDTGTFTVTLTAVNDTSQCGRYSNTNTINIVVGKLEAVSSGFTATTDYGCAPLMVDFTNNSINATAYYWLFGNGEVDSAKNPPTVTYPDSGTYTVTLIAFNESPLCPTSPDVKTLDITVGECDLYFPNVITPNGDQMNDIFQFTAKGYTNCNLTIFNRWGQQVYTSPLTDSFWDGTWNLSGEKVVDGTYYYLFTATDFYRKPFTQKGSILVIW